MSQKGIFRITGRMANGDIKGKDGMPFHHEGFLQPLMEKSACHRSHRFLKSPSETSCFPPINLRHIRIKRACFFAEAGFVYFTVVNHFTYTFRLVNVFRHTVKYIMGAVMM